MLKRTDYAEKRQFGRRQTQLRGWIKVAGRPPVTCIVRDLSEGGALIETETETWLPFNFRLTTEDGQVDRHCEIRHQKANRIGVEFAAAAEAHTSSSLSSVSDPGGWTGGEKITLRRW